MPLSAPRRVRKGAKTELFFYIFAIHDFVSLLCRRHESAIRMPLSAPRRVKKRVKMELFLQFKILLSNFT